MRSAESDALFALMVSGFHPMDVVECYGESCCRNSGSGPRMQPRRIARVTSFGPDDLRVIFKAYDDAWSEIAPKVGTDPKAVEFARMTLASIVLGLATANALAPDGLKTMATMAFWAQHRTGGWGRLAG
jgi:hypothetical protein